MIKITTTDKSSTGRKNIEYKVWSDNSLIFTTDNKIEAEVTAAWIQKQQAQQS